MLVQWIDPITKETKRSNVKKIEERDGHIYMSTEDNQDRFCLPLSSDIFVFGQLS